MTDSSTSSPKPQRLAKATYSFVGSNPNELNIVEGEIIYVQTFDENGWASGSTSKGDFGFFPSTYVQLLDEGASMSRT